MVRRGIRRFVVLGIATLVLATGLGAIADTPATAAPSGQLGAWGEGSSGQLGNGGSTGSTAAVSVLTTGVLAGKLIVQVDAGDAHACAVTSDGVLACWGSNKYGQLGIGAGGNQTTPQAVTGGALAGKTVVQVSTGAVHTCALTKDALLACWGSGLSGALGDGLGTSSPVPVAVFTGGVLAGRKVTQVSAGTNFTCVVASSAVACWGTDSVGELGDNSVVTRLIPVLATAAAGSALAGKTVTQVSAGVDHACARSSDGSLACWGSNLSQQVTPSAAVKQVLVPTPVDQGALAGRTVSQVSAGSQITCAVASGSAVCWGLNQVGQMANGPASKVPQPNPSLVTTTAPSALAGKVVASVSATNGRVCALTTDGSIACWGYGGGGGLGVAAADPGLTVPFSVTGSPGSGVMSGAIARGVATGDQFSIALTSSVPGSPAGLTATPGDGRASVSWTAPTSTGGSPVTSFVVQQSTDAGTTWTSASGSPTAGGATSLVVTGLPNGVNVTFRVAAVTVAGQGAFSTPTSVVRPGPAVVTPTPTPSATPTAPAFVRPGAVQGLTRSNKKSRVVVLTWQPPATGSVPTSYQVRRKQGTHAYSAWATVSGRALTVRKLKKGKKYSFAVRAGNAAGFGPGTVTKITVH